MFTKSNIINKYTGKRIVALTLSDNKIKLYFGGGFVVHIFDNGQRCCEERFITTDDNLSLATNTRFRNLTIKGTTNDDYSDDEIKQIDEILFLKIQTDKACFTFETHNKHNGYYGGFDIQIEEKK